MELEERVDAGRAAEVRKRLLGLIQPRSRITVSLSRVTYLDTAGVAVLVEMSRRAKDEGICLSLSGLSDAAAASLEVARLRHFFPPDEAIA